MSRNFNQHWEDKTLTIWENPRLITAVVRLQKRASYRTHDPNGSHSLAIAPNGLICSHKESPTDLYPFHKCISQIHVNCMGNASWRRLQLGVIMSFIWSYGLPVCICHSKVDSARLCEYHFWQGRTAVLLVDNIQLPIFPFCPTVENHSLKDLFDLNRHGRAVCVDPPDIILL